MVILGSLQFAICSSQIFCCCSSTSSSASQLYTHVDSHTHAQWSWCLCASVCARSTVGCDTMLCCAFVLRHVDAVAPTPLPIEVTRLAHVVGDRIPSASNSRTALWLPPYRANVNSTGTPRLIRSMSFACRRCVIKYPLHFLVEVVLNVVVVVVAAQTRMET